ncbi:MAG: family 43 glycosylhydrolase [Luteibacter sp.]|uniref:family 43 glycosylhydrolase n=1 Tax=Luteibacter sp. TaxID=1886636 RepID=UPI002809717A|nr:family 43 glycosylhydrolase [Luteibacter sp.]MDQ7996048.1 family 43 glycosylhydrolase [Luteibacter sp.]
MALKRISDYAAATALDGTEMLELETAAGQSKKATAQQIASLGAGSGGIPEAPEDGRQYGRQNGGWTEVVGGGGGGDELEGGLFRETEQARGLVLTKKGVVVQSSSVSGSWKENRVESPHVFWDAKIGQYRMVYLGYSGAKGSPSKASVGFATANTPEGPWVDYASNPVLPPSNTAGAPDQNGCSAPHVWIEDGTYYLFYLGLTGVGLEQGNKSICLATSTDFLTWTRRGSVITPMDGTWRANAVWHPNIVKRGDTYYMFFNANIGSETIGYATSTDLMTWTVQDSSSPILSPSSSGWDNHRVGDPYVWNKGDVWYMAYYGAGGSNDYSQEGMAYTLDADFPLGWKKYAAFNPVIPVGAAGTYDNESAGRGCVLVTPYRLYHWYTTGNGAGNLVEIALAVDDTLCPADLRVSGIPDAPSDGAFYARKNNAWASFTPGGGGGGGFVGCHAHSTVVKNGGSTSSSFTFEVNDVDTSGIHSTSLNTSRFTIPAGLGGLWRVSFKAVSGSPAGINYLFIRKNGGDDSNNVPGSTVGIPGNSPSTAYLSQIMTLLAGDYIELFIYSNGGSQWGHASDVGQQTFFEMEYLG